MDPLIPTTMCQIVTLLSFYKDRLGTKKPAKVDMPLNKETKPNQIKPLKPYNYVLIISIR